ncbi:SDR family NAD(P)-dependent oxidoreductase [Bradyrhizobium sp. CCGUVB14]|uniref:SDR family NAD(P)-dependent oxidoreductase n=1 Tax=Bradyrhizobium sp. CCGUVB14 TaxID=2949628 RepID=UPI0020B358F6|nr:SDR family NAD(P)-dependent oxidoreductase [Bradyrhizobium sp. CCGUVB14]MCP3446089.1 SDR family oxidoreductase [Bradyrhizobium sp. CCGUVB14]
MTNPAKVVIVSGGTFGIGRAITVGLAARGHDVVAFGLESAQVSSLAQAAIPSLRDELASRKLAAMLLEADVSKAADVKKVVDATMEKHGRIDAIVNNAAIGPLGTILDTDEALFERIVSVNLKGPFLLSRMAVPHMKQQGGGAIINVGSGAGWGKPNMAVYSASKGGLHALSTAMAYDFIYDRIKVNTVIPGGGGIISGMSLGRVGGDQSRLGKGAPGTAAGRVATGDDIANVIAFLLSPEAETLSGTVIDVGCFANQGGPVPPKPAA